MARVLEECDHVAASFSADPVHDLRVSLRRCRSLADGMIALDPDPDWKAMKKAGKRLFQRLGALRDVQVMMEWIEKLHPPKASVERALLPALPEEAERSVILWDAAPATAPKNSRRSITTHLRAATARILRRIVASHNGLIHQRATKMS